MARRVFKFELRPAGRNRLQLPGNNPAILKMAVQSEIDGHITIWAEVDDVKMPDAGPSFDVAHSMTEYEFLGVLTGDEAPGPPWVYRDTFLFNNGSFVVHLYQRSIACA